MAHAPGTLSQHDQFKVQYAERMKSEFGAAGILQERFPFREKERTGEKYILPVLTRRVQGGDYATTGAGQVNFSDIKSSTIVQAELQGSQFFLSNAVDWESAFSSDSKGKKSFKPEFDLAMRDLWDAGRYRTELLLLWGQHASGSIGRVDGTPAANVITIRTAECAPGILYNLEGATLTARDFANLATERAATLFVTAVDPEARTITVTDDGAVADGDVLFYDGELVAASATFKTGAGLMKWAGNTGSLAGISAATNVVWKPTTVSCGNDILTFDKVLKAAVQVQIRGHRGKLLLLTSPESWADVMNDMTAVIRRSQDQKKYMVGAESVEFHTGIGSVEILAHPYMKRGYSVLVPESTPQGDEDPEDPRSLDNNPVRRVGAQDLCFVGPDGKTSESKRDGYVEKLQRTNLFTVDLYTHQTIFPTSPARIVLFNNIVPSISA